MAKYVSLIQFADQGIRNIKGTIHPQQHALTLAAAHLVLV